MILKPDLPITRTRVFNRVETIGGEILHTSQRLYDLLPYIAAAHPEGLVAEIEDDEYLVTVALRPRRPPNG